MLLYNKGSQPPQTKIGPEYQERTLFSVIQLNAQSLTTEMLSASKHNMLSIVWGACEYEALSWPYGVPHITKTTMDLPVSDTYLWRLEMSLLMNCWSGGKHVHAKGGKRSPNAFNRFWNARLPMSMQARVFDER